MLNRRLPTHRAGAVVVLAAVVAIAVAATPSLAGSFLTNQKAAKVYISNKKASTLYLKKKVASNTFVKKVEAPLTPIAAIAAGTSPFSASATTAGYIPTAFTSFSTKGIAPAVITFSGSATCTAALGTADLACPIQILIDGQTTGKVNFAPATTNLAKTAPIVHSVTQTTVLGKGGHTVAIQYAGAAKVTFTLTNWNLAVQAYPQLPEATPTETSAPATTKK